MEVFIFGWWWTSHQSLAHIGLRILRFCIVPWKDEREPTIKLCMGRQIDVVQKFTRIQNFGQNWWWANEIRVEYFPRIHHIAALPQSPRVTVKIERNTKKFTGRIIFISMFSDISWGSEDNKKECESNAQLVSLCEETWSKTMVIPRTWIREKWYSIGEDSPQGEWDRFCRGQNCRAGDVDHLQKAHTQSSDPRVHCPEECLRAKVVENCQYTIAPTLRRLKLFFARLFL